MARKTRRNNAAASTNHVKATVKSFGRPRPVVCDDEASWFEQGADADTKQAAKSYIRERFKDLLESDEVEQLATNDVMLAIIAQHQELFRKQNEAA